MRSNPAYQLFFYFLTRKYFTIYIKFLEFLRWLDRLKYLLGLLLVGLYGLERKFLIKLIIVRLTVFDVEHFSQMRSLYTSLVKST